MRVLVRSVTKHELVIDDNGLTPTGQVYADIPDVLNDESADDYEKTRTIVEVIKGSCPDSTHSDYDVYIFDDKDVLMFTGHL